jgi:hypothetical protein
MAYGTTRVADATAARLAAAHPSRHADDSLDAPLFERRFLGDHDPRPTGDRDDVADLRVAAVPVTNPVPDVRQPQNDFEGRHSLEPFDLIRQVQAEGLSSLCLFRGRRENLFVAGGQRGAYSGWPPGKRGERSPVHDRLPSPDGFERAPDGGDPRADRMSSRPRRLTQAT